MPHLKFNGLIEEIIERYPNIDMADFLQDKLQIPVDKAEELAARIEKQILHKTDGAKQKCIRLILEKTEKPEPAPQASMYPVDSLSQTEFKNFIPWLLKELGYEIQQEQKTDALGVDLVAAKNGEKIAVLARRYPKAYEVSSAIVLIAQQAKCRYECNRTIVLATAHFSQQAMDDAQKLNVELWDTDALAKKITAVMEKPDVDVQPHFPRFNGSLLQSLLKLGETKTFSVEHKNGGKYDLHVPGVKFPLLTFQAIPDSDTVVRCIFRIKYNEPVSEADGEALISSDRHSNRVGPDDKKAYELIIQYLEQFLE